MRGNNTASQSPVDVQSYSGSSPSSPQSPRTRFTPVVESPRSPRDRLEDFLRAEDVQVNGDGQTKDKPLSRMAHPAPSKAQSYTQLRNISSPLPEATLGHSSPPSPRSAAASPPLIGSPLRSNQAVRTSSIDSAISSVSLATTHSPKGSFDSNSTTSSDVSGLIKAAGSAESLIVHLLKDKQHLEGRTAQLWSVVEKQRKLLLGLNEDLIKVAKDKERYRKEAEDLRRAATSPTSPKSLQATATPFPNPPSRSPANSDSSAGLPIQKLSQDEVENDRVFEDVKTPQPLKILRREPSTDVPELSSAALGANESISPSSTVKGTSKHAHKHTSSSDLGVFNVTKTHNDMPALQTEGLDNYRELVLASPTVGSPQAISATSPGSFTAKRSQASTSKTYLGPGLTLTESTPTGNDTDRMTPPRKLPPAPLDLVKPNRAPPGTVTMSKDNDSDSEYGEEDIINSFPVFDRGRKKTREEDDTEREVLQRKQEEERSRSKKQKSSTSRSHSKKAVTQDPASKDIPQVLPLSPAVKAFAPEPTPGLASSFLSQPGSLASMLDPIAGQRGPTGQFAARSMQAPLSPGLPLSPRPGDRPQNAPTPRLPRDPNNTTASVPLSPNAGFVGLPVSPRAMKQQAPFLPTTPLPVASPSATHQMMRPNHTWHTSPAPAQTVVSSEKASLDSDSSRSMGAASSNNQGIFKGFASDAYPGLLLPPNALPSIKVTVISSRLKPSRHSVVFKGDDEPVFTLGVSARYDAQDLWVIEKPILSLQSLDHQLRQSSKIEAKLPEKSLFVGHAPTKVDARRIALERYFEILLDTQLDEKAAVSLCQYLSTNASEPFGKDAAILVDPVSPKASAVDERTVKEGYLTKRGKNFGGWKARYFVLDEPMLRYYEGPNGTLLGTIKLYRAKIGKQSPPKASDSSDEGDGQYRHAFLIREPKKKDSNSYVDHVLCAENDHERDAWVAGLLGYINTPELDAKSKPKTEREDSNSSKIINASRRNTSRQKTQPDDSPKSDEFEGLQAVPYEDTRAALPPQVHITPDPRSENTPSPSMSGLGSPSVEKANPSVAKPISGPQNGAKISDAGAWGNKPLSSPLPAQREHKKRSFFGFHNKEPATPGFNDPNGGATALTQSQQQYAEQITNVKAAFGAPLAEAAVRCGPKGVEDACLPAVVYRCLQYLEVKGAANEEGIFRLPGSTTLIKTLKTRFNNEGDFDLLASEQWYDINAVASLLKQYLRELPSFILTKELHLNFAQVAGQSQACSHVLCVSELTFLRMEDRQQPQDRRLQRACTQAAEAELLPPENALSIPRHHC